jgi:hypothetical protein
MAFFGRATSRTASRTGGDGKKKAGQYPGGGDNHQYDNHDGPVRPGGDPRGDTIDYGPSNGPSQQERIDNAWKKWGGSGLYVNGVEMPWAHGPNQERGKRAPFFTPDVLDPRNAGYFAGGTTPEQDAARAAVYYGQEAAAHEGYMDNSTYANAYNSLVGQGYDPNRRDVKQQMRVAGVKSGKYDDPEMLAALKEWERAKRVAQFGLPDDWTPPSKKGPWPAPHAPPAGGTQTKGSPAQPGLSTATGTLGGNRGGSGKAPIAFEGYKGSQSSSNGRWVPGPSGNAIGVDYGGGEWIPYTEQEKADKDAKQARMNDTGFMSFGPAPSKPSGMQAAIGTKKPTIVRRGGGKVERR